MSEMSDAAKAAAARRAKILSRGKDRMNVLLGKHSLPEPIQQSEMTDTLTHPASNEDRKEIQALEQQSQQSQQEQQKQQEQQEQQSQQEQQEQQNLQQNQKSQEQEQSQQKQGQEQQNLESIPNQQIMQPFQQPISQTPILEAQPKIQSNNSPKTTKEGSFFSLSPQLISYWLVFLTGCVLGIDVFPLNISVLDGFFVSLIVSISWLYFLEPQKQQSNDSQTSSSTTSQSSLSPILSLLGFQLSEHQEQQAAFLLRYINYMLVVFGVLKMLLDQAACFIVGWTITNSLKTLLSR